MKHPLSLEAFADFCDKQGDREYNWYDGQACTCAQYAEFLGMTQPWLYREPGSRWSQLSLIASPKYHETDDRVPFSALAARLRLEAAK